MPVFNNILAGASGQAGGAAAGYEIERSLRFNSADSAYLSRVPVSAGNRKTWTWAGWVKRSAFGSTPSLFSVLDGGSIIIFGFESSETLRLQGSGINVITTPVYRDPSAWYHVVLSFDTTQATAADRVKIHVNGAIQGVSGTYPTLNTDYSVNVAAEHQIASYNASAGRFFDGYLADVHFIDGQALDPTSFGEFDDNGVWQPIEYSGTYGTNGFHLKFDNTADLGEDAAGSNDWTVNNISATSLTYTTSGGTVVNAADAFDGNVGTFSQTSTGQNSTYTLSPAVAVPSGRIDLHVRYDPVFTYKAVTNIGTITFSYQGTWPGGGSSYPGHYYISNASVTSFSAIILETSNSSYNWTFTGVQVAGDPNSVGNQFLVTAAGSDVDSFVDSPTNGDTANDTGLGGELAGNYATLNPLANQNNLANGNLDISKASNAGFAGTFATVAITSGKYYWEYTSTLANNASNVAYLGISGPSVPLGSVFGNDAASYIYQSNSGQKRNASSGSSYGASWTTANDVIGIAFDADAGTLTFYKNGVSQGVAFSSIPAGVYLPSLATYAATSVTGVFNFGQRPFAYSAPSGFKALCTANLDTPTIEDGSTAMDVVLWTGNSSTQTISGMNMSPDWVWVKGRAGSLHPAAFDTVRGANKYWYPSLASAEVSGYTNTLTSFNSDGFTLGADSSNQVNLNTYSYVGWCWDAGTSTVANTDGDISSSVRVNANAGFSIVSYTGNGSNNQTVGHGLGVTPSVVIVKSRDGAQEALVYHKEGTAGKNLLLHLNNSEGAWSEGYITSPNSTTFNLAPGSSSISNINVNTHKHIAYCMAAVEGFSSFGKFTGNGLTDGPFIYTGHRTRWLMIKKLTASGQWWIWDTERDTYNVSDAVLRTTVNDENTYSGLTDVDILSNGFKLRGNGADVNASGGIYVFFSFAENPFKYARAR